MARCAEEFPRVGFSSSFSLRSFGVHKSRLYIRIRHKYPFYISLGPISVRKSE